MNESVGLLLVPIRNSLILIGLTFRTFSAVVSNCLPPCVGFVHQALPTRSPLKGAGPEVTLKVALTLAPGATFRVTSGPAPFNGDLVGNAWWTNPTHGGRQFETTAEKVRNVSPVSYTHLRIGTSSNPTDSF